MKKKMSVILIVLALIVSLVGCTPGSGVLKSPTEMTPQEKGILVLSLYNNSWDNYQAQFAATVQPMSDDMKSYFQSWKVIMQTAEPVVGIYISTVKSGGTPSPELEQQIYALIYKFQAMMTKPKGGK